MAKPKLMTAFFLVAFSIALLLLHSFPAFFLVKHGVFTQNSQAFGFVAAMCALLALVAVPIICIKYFFKKSPADFGFRLPEDVRESVRLSGLALLVFLPIVIFFGTRPEFQQYYILKEKINIFFIFSILTSALYYFSEEFLFRGFLFFGLIESLGTKFKWFSFLIINLLFAFFHIGKPFSEIVFAFFLGVVFCYLSLKTKSFLPAATLHFVLAILLNLTVFLLIH
jgi:membrane protease YdiL (CAAX protease family)